MPRNGFHDDLEACLKVLQEGGIILYPTDTIWDLGCDASNEAAVSRIYEIKKRSDTQSMLVLVDSPAKLQAYVSEVPDMAWDLMELSEKPLTIIYPDARNVAPNLMAADRFLGIRVSNEAFSKALCERFRRPIVSTSANISGQVAPQYFGEITEEIKSSADYIVQFRQQERKPAQASFIIKLGKGNLIQIIRQ